MTFRHNRFIESPIISNPARSSRPGRFPQSVGRAQSARRELLRTPTVSIQLLASCMQFSARGTSISERQRSQSSSWTDLLLLMIAPSLASSKAGRPRFLSANMAPALVADGTHDGACA